MPTEKHGNVAKGINLTFCVIASLLVLMFLPACGNGDEDAEAPTVTPSTPTPTAAPIPTPTPTQPYQTLLPCHVDLAAAQEANLAASPTPETIRIQMLEQPFRIVPNDIVLQQNRSYRLIIQADNEWRNFTVSGLGVEVDIPPNGEAIVDVQPESTGVFPIADQRKVRASHLLRTITVVPSNMSASSWNQWCAELQVHFPPSGAELSMPFVIEGSIGAVEIRPYGGLFHVTRIEVWSGNEVVGETTPEQFTFRNPYSDFFVVVPTIPPGRHSLMLRAYLQNGVLVATATYQITVLPDTQMFAATAASQGSIDFPAEDSLIELPLTVRGWAAVFGSGKGTGVGAVEVWDGPRESGRFLAKAVHGTYRADVAQVYGEPRLATSGWFARLEELPVGPLALHLYVRDQESGAYVAPFENEPPPKRNLTLAEGKLTEAQWPVALAAAPDGRLFFAELFTGQIRIWQDGNTSPFPFATLGDVSAHRESGLLGLTLHPDFPQEPFVYAMYVVDNPDTGYPLMQRVVRYRDVDGIGKDYAVILNDLPATTGTRHNGGRISFGPDGKLYVVIGDIDIPEISQDLTNVAGSILRYNPDGSVPDDNPLPGSPIYASGLRNTFGLAFQPNTGALYATENGPGGYDEINIIEAGANYGWPLHTGFANAEGFNDPIAEFGIWPDSPTYAPTGATFALGRPDLFLFCAFHVQALHALELSGPDFTAVKRQMALSRNCVLDVTASDDGWLYYSTISAIYRARLDDLLRLYEQKTQ